MKLTIVWFDLNFKFLIIFRPTVGVIARKTHLPQAVNDEKNVVNVVELYVLVGFARRSLAMYKRMEGALN